MSTVIDLFRYEVHEFPWGSAIKEQRTRKWTKLFLKPSGQEVDLEGLEVILHDNGIEFLEDKA